MMKYTFVFTAIVTGFIAHTAMAAPILFRPQNPAIFANAPINGNAALLSSVVRPDDPNVRAPSSALNPGRIVQQSVLGQVSSRINDQIFGGSELTGTFDLGDGSSIAYDRTGGILIINVIDPASGQTTISLPGL